MALGDKQVLNSSVADGNSDYLIPGAVSLRLKAVQALFTDNGAGGDWLPAVVAISDSGHVFWRACDQGVKVTAGSDAEVSWFPGVKHAAAAAAGFAPAWAFATKAGLGVIGPGTVGVTWTSLDTTSPAVFSLNAGNHAIIEIATPGIYLLSGYMQMVAQPTSFTTTTYMFADVEDANSTIVGTYFGNFFRFDDATVGDPKEVSIAHGEDYTNGAATFAFPITVKVFFQLGQAVNVGGATVTLTRLTPAGV